MVYLSCLIRKINFCLRSLPSCLYSLFVCLLIHLHTRAAKCNGVGHIILLVLSREYNQLNKVFVL